MKEAVVARFQQLCRERGIRYNQLANLSGVTPSTVYSMMDPSRKDVSVVTVKKLCDGLDLSVAEFFSDPLFEDDGPALLTTNTVLPLASAVYSSVYPDEYPLNAFDDYGEKILMLNYAKIRIVDVGGK